MLTRVHIENFKSIVDLDLSLGRVNVLIGENGSGKTNVLEALAYAAGYASRKLDEEFLATRGVRSVDWRRTVSAFPGISNKHIHLLLESGPSRHRQTIGHDEEGRPYAIKTTTAESSSSERFDIQGAFVAAHELEAFLIFTPEPSALRVFDRPGQVRPIGVRGEGLFRVLGELAAQPDRWDALRENLRLLDWYEDMTLATGVPFDETLRVKDRYLAADVAYIDQRSANEGFLLLLFHFALFLAPKAPRFFAIDNVDASLNPKLCAELMRRLVVLAGQYGKQVIFTTHNPALLDGLDLHDDDQRLFVTFRNDEGHTRLRRVDPPNPVAGEPPIKLSMAFMRGLLGGLPKNF